MKLFYPLLVILALVFAGCEGASESDSPTITLKGDRDITLKVGEVIYEPGYTATDPQDGDITNRVQVTSNIDFYKEGQYYVNYSVKDSDGNVANASRVVTISNNASNNSAYDDWRYENDNNLYDYAVYGYNYRVYVEGLPSNEIIYQYDKAGNQLQSQTIYFEKNREDGSIYEFVDNNIVSRDFIGFDNITSYDNSSNMTTQHQRMLRIGDTYTEKGMTCRVAKNYPAFTTNSITGLNIPNFNYINVLEIDCQGNGRNMQRYYANGYGEILRVEDDSYYIVDKNSINAQLIAYHK